MVPMPTLVGLPEDSARVLLGGAGLRLGEVAYDFSMEPSGRVLVQEPAAGTQVRVGSAVKMRVASSSPPTELMPMVSAHQKF